MYCKHTQTKNHLAELFRLYWNSFLTIAYFAEYYGITKARAYRIINTGRKIHNSRCKS